MIGRTISHYWIVEALEYFQLSTRAARLWISIQPSPSRTPFSDNALPPKEGIAKACRPTKNIRSSAEAAPCRSRFSVTPTPAWASAARRSTHLSSLRQLPKLRARLPISVGLHRARRQSPHLRVVGKSARTMFHASRLPLAFWEPFAPTHASPTCSIASDFRNSFDQSADPAAAFPVVLSTNFGGACSVANANPTNTPAARSASLQRIRSQESKVRAQDFFLDRVESRRELRPNRFLRKHPIGPAK